MQPKLYQQNRHPIHLYLIFEKSSSTNWFFKLQKSILKLIFAVYTGSKNPVRNRLKIQFVKLDFSNSIFQKLSTDQQGVSLLGRRNVMKGSLGCSITISE